MRTTIDIADDVLRAAKELARREHKTAGQVISELARQALTQPAVGGGEGEREEVFGFEPFPHRGGIVTNELIDRLREEDPG
jgi:hypothetical protein